MAVQAIPQENSCLYAATKAVSIAAVCSASAAAVVVGHTIPLLFSTVLGSGIILTHAISSLTSLDLTENLQELSKKVEFVFRMIVWTGLMVGAIASGMGLGLILKGGVQLFFADTALKGFFGLYFLANAFGYYIPFGRWMLNTSQSLDLKINEGMGHLVENLQRWPDMRVESALSMLIAQTISDVDVDMLEFVPENQMRQYFQNNAPLFSDEKIGELIHKYPNVYTYEFLFGCLSEDQITRILVPELMRGCEAKYALAGIEATMEDWARRVVELKAQGGEEVHKAASDLLQELSQKTNTVVALHQLIRKLPPEPVAHHQAQFLMTQLRREGERIRQLQHQLVDPSEKSLRRELTDLVERTAPKNQEDDLDEEAYMVLGALGWRLHEFKIFAPTLGLPSDGNAMATVSQALAERGLATRRDLLQHGILAVPKKEEDPDERGLSRELIAERLRQYLSGVQQPQVVEAAPMISQTTWRQVAKVANYVFHYATSAALIAFQMFYQPVSTAAGIIYGLMNPEGRAQLAVVWQSSPEYVDQSIEERCRELSSRMFWVSWSLFCGAAGGFWSGMQHADAIRHYYTQLV
jgi:hypothetical protein